MLFLLVGKTATSNTTMALAYMSLKGNATFQLEVSKIITYSTEVYRFSEYHLWSPPVKNPETSYLFMLLYVASLFSRPLKKN